MNGIVASEQPSLDRLYQLLPAPHRQRDEALGWPLRDLLRVIAEPIERAGHGGGWTESVYAASALLQVGAAAVFVAQLWPRVAPRAAKAEPNRSSVDRGRRVETGAA